MAAPLQSVIRHLCLAVVARNSTTVTDAQLLERFVSQRDEAAFELLVWRHGKMVLGTCRRLLRDAHEAEDAFQACFLALARHAGSIGRRESVGGWLHKVAYRVALGAKARRSKREARERSLGDRAPPAGPPDPAAEAAWREVGYVLGDELNRLPDKFRVPFVLCCLEGRSNADVARELGCPLGTVESRLVRARQRLRAGLSRRGVAPSAGLLAVLSGGGAASAFVPAALVSSTVKAATLIAAGRAATAGLVSARVAAMTEGVLKAMWMTKLKAAAVVLVAVALAGTGTGVLTYHPAAARQTGPAPGAGQTPAPTAGEAARIAKLIDQLGSDAFTERQQATKELEEIGAPALDALRKATQDGELERRRRAEDLVRKLEARLEAARILAPRRVRLAYQDTPLAEAVADFKRKSGYDITLSDPDGKLKDRKITLDTGEVTFWQALDQFCRQARLVEAAPAAGVPLGPQAGVGGGGRAAALPAVPLPAGGAGGGGGGPLPPPRAGGGGAQAGAVFRGAAGMPTTAEPLRIILADGQPRPLPTDDGSAVRIRALGKADGLGTPADGEILLALEVAPEPRLRWLRTVAVTVRNATDDRGQTLEQVMPTDEAPAGVVVGRVPRPPGNLPGAGVVVGQAIPGPAAQAPRTPVRLKKGTAPATSLRELAGIIAVQVLQEPQPYLAVNDIVNAAGKSVQGADGGTLRVLDVSKTEAGRLQVRLAIEPPAAGAPAGRLSRLSSRAGRAVLSAGDGTPEHELALEDDKGNVLPPVGLAVRSNAGGGTEYTLTYAPQGGRGEPARLVYALSKAVTVDVAFKLRNVPLP